MAGWWCRGLGTWAMGHTTTTGADTCNSQHVPVPDGTAQHANTREQATQHVKREVGVGRVCMTQSGHVCKQCQHKTSRSTCENQGGASGHSLLAPDAGTEHTATGRRRTDDRRANTQGNLKLCTQCGGDESKHSTRGDGHRLFGSGASGTGLADEKEDRAHNEKRKHRHAGSQPLDPSNHDNQTQWDDGYGNDCMCDCKHTHHPDPCQCSCDTRVPLACGTMRTHPRTHLHSRAVPLP